MNAVATEEDAVRAAKIFSTLANNVAQVIKGKNNAIHMSCVCLFAGGHLLIEDVPGVGKTTLAKSLAISMGGTQNRIQFTPDLLPTDVSGTTIFDQKTSEFIFKPGPIFANIVLADEINRASPKTQSALLEAMEEHRVTFDGKTYTLPHPHMVIATQNPIELSGTYTLPEAQLDRFMMSLSIGYPSDVDEVSIMLSTDSTPEIYSVISPDDFQDVSEIARTIYVAESLAAYIVSLAGETRENSDVALGVSPRGSIALYHAAQVLALSMGRHYVTPDDIKTLVTKIWEHRIILTSQARLAGATSSDVLAAILARVNVPIVRTS
ncbi:MAG TPA: MoxR family ATPase [Acidimicrobiia bacterium]|nr:MoxR family ATPase [Acidimicrobiia bacterium]